MFVAVVASIVVTAIFTLQDFGLGDRFPPERFAPTVGAAVDAASGERRDDIGGAI